MTKIDDCHPGTRYGEKKWCAHWVANHVKIDKPEWDECAQKLVMTCSYVRPSQMLVPDCKLAIVTGTFIFILYRMMGR